MTDHPWYVWHIYVKWQTMQIQIMGLPYLLRYLFPNIMGKYNSRLDFCHKNLLWRTVGIYSCLYFTYPKYLDNLISYNMVNVLKFHTLKCLTKWHVQTVQTQIRRSSLTRVYTVCQSTKYYKKQLHKKAEFRQKKKRGGGGGGGGGKEF